MGEALSSLAVSSVGWTTGWLNLLGQTAGVASTEFGLAQMICESVILRKHRFTDVAAGLQGPVALSERTETLW